MRVRHASSSTRFKVRKRSKPASPPARPENGPPAQMRGGSNVNAPRRRSMYSAQRRTRPPGCPSRGGIRRSQAAATIAYSSARKKRPAGSGTSEVEGVVAGVVDPGPGAGRDDEDRERLLDERGSVHLGAHAERGAVIHRGVDVAVAEVHGARAAAGGVGDFEVADLGEMIRFRGPAPGDEADAAQQRLLAPE